MNNPPNDQNAIGLALQRARLDAGLLQRDLAPVMGVSIWTLSRVECGLRRFDATWLPRLPAEVRAPVAMLLRDQVRRQFWNLRDLSVPPAA